jgi:type VI protein secretion system component VasK
MSAISDALFPQQGGALAMKYKLSVQPNPAVKEVKGALDGQPFSMSGKEYAWPTAKPGVDLRVEQSGGGNTPLRSYSGIWGIFQLLSNENHAAGQPNLFRLVNVRGESRGSNPQPILPDGSAIVLEVIEFPNGVRQAFDKDFFAVSCPKGIFE